MASSRFGRDIEEVLNNAAALEAFREWIEIDPQRSVEVPDLYFALKGFKNYLRSPDAALRAQTIHRKYISLKTGTCDFIPTEARQEMSNHIHNLKSNASVSASLFDPVWHPLLNLLRSWHAHFVCSQPFSRLVMDEYEDSNEGYTEVLSTQEFARKHRKPRYFCDASTSRAFVDATDRTFNSGEEKVYLNNTKRQMKRTNLKQKSTISTYRHEKAEERERFVRDVTMRLQRIADELSLLGDNVYARDIILPAFAQKEKEQTTSDDEVEKYADRLDRRRSASESPPLVNSFAPAPPVFNSFAPTVPGYDFNVDIPNRYGTQRIKARTPGFHDTSGFCSSESAYFSSERSYGHRSSGFNESGFRHHTPFSATLQRRAPVAPPPIQNVFATLPRRMSQSKISCRLWRDGEVAPYTATIAGPVVTLHQFRKTFGIRRNENLRLLFKSPCDDNSAPFQWSLISEDSQTLPLFEGKIAAEARVYVDSD